MNDDCFELINLCVWMQFGVKNSRLFVSEKKARQGFSLSFFVFVLI